MKGKHYKYFFFAKIDEAIYGLPCSYSKNFPKMNVQSFYGNLKYTDEIADGLQSDDENISDTDEEEVRVPLSDQDNIFVPETDESDLEDHCEKPTTSKKKQPKKPRAAIWNESHLPPYSNENFPFQGNTNLPDIIEELETPAEFFNFFFNDDLIEFIVEQSNLFALQIDINKPANITKNEIEQFVGK